MLELRQLCMKEEILPINLLRFLAALAVVCVHDFIFLFNNDYIPRSFKIFIPLTQYGHLGVNLFFIISGFVISLSTEGKTFGQFISSRFIRLYPVFWISVSITSLFIIFIGREPLSISKYLANMTMLPSYYGNEGFIEYLYWTLEFELKFYLMIAVILLVKPIVNISQQKFAVFLSIPLVYNILFYSPSTTISVRTLFEYFFNTYYQNYAQYFIAGMIFYGIYKNSKNYYNYIAIAACYVVAILIAADRVQAPNSKFGVTSFITSFFLIFLAISLRKVTNESFRFLGKHYKQILITLGVVTYPLYLLHGRMIYLIMEIFNRYNIPPHIASQLLLFIAISIILAVNNIDYYIRSAWNRSHIVKEILVRLNIPLLRKIL